MFKSYLVALVAVTYLFKDLKAEYTTKYCFDYLPKGAKKPETFTSTSRISEYANKCIVECVLRESGMLVNGLINVIRLTETLALDKSISQKKMQKLKTIADDCRYHRHLSDDKCLTAAFFLQCSSDRAERKGWDSNIMAEAVVSIYETVLRRILFPTLKADEFYNNFAKYDV